MRTDLSVLPKVKDVYITMLPGNDFREVANKAKELVQSGFNPVPHFPARSIKNLNELKDYVSMCKDFGVKQALVIKIKDSTNNFHIYTFGGLKETNNWLSKNNYA